MPSPNAVLERHAAREALGVRVSGVDVAVHAPDFVVSALARVLAGVPRVVGEIDARHAISVDADSGAWEIVAPRTRTVLSMHGELPRLIGALVSSILYDAAEASGLATVRGTVLEKDGRGLAILGDDWESGLTVATHLHARGWRYVSGDHVLIDPETLRAVGFEKSLYATASAASAFPLPYRRAVEASPWYVSANEVAFYAVDPTMVDAQSWSRGAVLDAYLLIDGATEERPSLQSALARDLANRPSFGNVDLSRIEGATMTLGPIIESCDLVEHWFEAVPSRIAR